MKLNSTELRSFFYGTLLGDSYIHNHSFCCKQISKDLIEFKGKIIQRFIPDTRVNIQEYPAYTDKNGVHHQKYWQLTTTRCEYVNKLERLFYPDGKKVLPLNSIKRLTPLGLAMWYADDGATILVGKNSGHAKNRRVQLCTDCFTKEELNCAVKEFNNIGYNPTLLKRNEEMYRLQFTRLERQKLLIEISPYFYNYFPSLLYKLDLGYRGDSLLKRNYVLEEYYNLYTKISAHPDFRDRLKIGDDIV